MTTADQPTDRQTDDTVTFHLREVVPSHIFYGIPRGDDGKLFRLDAWNIKQNKQNKQNQQNQQNQQSKQTERATSAFDIQQGIQETSKSRA